MLPAVTRQEVDELQEQLELRRTLWIKINAVWLRQHKKVKQLAFKLQNGLPHNMYSIHVMSLQQEALSQEEAERYMLWLLKKFTSYGERLRLQELLSRELSHETQINIEQLARRAIELVEPRDVLVTTDIATSEPLGDLCLSLPDCFPRASDQDSSRDEAGERGDLQIAQALAASDRDTPPAAKSVYRRYIENLLRKKR